MATEPFIPHELIYNSADSIRASASSSSKIIYVSVLLAAVVALVSLPFIKVNIGVQSAAVIRPAADITKISALVSGRVSELHVHDNQHVRRGDILLTLESEVIDERVIYLLEKGKELDLLVGDLHKLISFPSANPALLTPLLRQDHINFKERLSGATRRNRKAKADYMRNEELHAGKVIADAEFEEFQFELDKTQIEVELIRQSQLAQWQSQLRGYERELLDCEAQLTQLRKEKEDRSIRAPISGSIQNITGIYPGSLVFSNQDLAQISPDTTLVVEAYVSPKDIGLLQKRMAVRFQVDAYNYNQWGLATGKVTEVSGDVQMFEELSVFKVTCSLDKGHLQLKNGYKGYLKKGMTLRARFLVTQRTLWQLLYDKADDWLNPNLATGDGAHR